MNKDREPRSGLLVSVEDAPRAIDGGMVPISPNPAKADP